MTLADPSRRNAQTPRTWAALAAVGEALLADDGVRVVLLRAEGRSFCAGLDRATFGRGTPGEPGVATLATMPLLEMDAAIAEFQRAFTWWRDPRVVSIAAVQGHAVGAGFQLALACDLRVLAEDAQLAMRETSLGLVPDLGGTGPLVDTVGYARALEICVTGRWVGADEAAELGLATVVVPVDELAAAAADLAAAVLAAPAESVRATTALLHGAAGRSAEERLAAERAAQAALLRSRGSA